MLKPRTSCVLIPLSGPDRIVSARSTGVTRPDVVNFLGAVYRLTPERSHGGYPVYREERRP